MLLLDFEQGSSIPWAFINVTHIVFFVLSWCRLLLLNIFIWLSHHLGLFSHAPPVFNTMACTWNSALKTEICKSRQAVVPSLKPLVEPDVYPYLATVKISSAVGFSRATGECCFHIGLRTQATHWFDPDTTPGTSRLRFEPNGMYLHRTEKDILIFIQCPRQLSCDWTHPIIQCGNQILISNINQYILPHWFLLAYPFSFPHHILRQLPSDKKMFSFLFHVATPVWLKSFCQTKWQDDSLGNEWKRHKPRGRERKDKFLRAAWYWRLFLRGIISLNCLLPEL